MPRLQLTHLSIGFDMAHNDDPAGMCVLYTDEDKVSHIQNMILGEKAELIYQLLTTPSAEYEISKDEDSIKIKFNNGTEYKTQDCVSRQDALDKKPEPKYKPDDIVWICGLIGRYIILGIDREYTSKVGNWSYRVVSFDYYEAKPIVKTIVEESIIEKAMIDKEGENK